MEEKFLLAKYSMEMEMFGVKNAYLSNKKELLEIQSETKKQIKKDKEIKKAYKIQERMYADVLLGRIKKTMLYKPLTEEELNFLCDELDEITNILRNGINE